MNFDGTAAGTSTQRGLMIVCELDGCNHADNGHIAPLPDVFDSAKTGDVVTLNGHSLRVVERTVVRSEWTDGADVAADGTESGGPGVGVQPTLAEYGQINYADAQRWFPAIIDAAAVVVDLGFGLPGETGEVVDILKKEHRRGGDWVERLRGHEHLAEEMADVLIYLVQLAVVLDVDLHDEWLKKRAFNETRFGSARPA